MAKCRSKTPRGAARRGGSGRRKPWTVEDDTALIDMWRKHVPLGKIAAKLGRTRSALQTRASRLNLPLSMSPDAFPDGKMMRCQGCGGVFFSKMRGLIYNDAQNDLIPLNKAELVTKGANWRHWPAPGAGSIRGVFRRGRRVRAARPKVAKSRRTVTRTRERVDSRDSAAVAYPKINDRRAS